MRYKGRRRVLKIKMVAKKTSGTKHPVYLEKSKQLE